MKNLLLLLLLANILYFIWGLFAEKPVETGVVVVDETQLGPPLDLSDKRVAEAATSVGAMLGSGQLSDLAAVVGRSCVTLGPFTTALIADEALAEFEGQGMRVGRRSTQGQIFVGHWVQIRNIENREVGNAMLDKLKTGGIGDAYLVENEGLSISLGLFGEMSRAERIELQAKSLGLSAEITPRMRQGTVYWVDVSLPPGKGAGQMIDKYGQDKVLLREAAHCPQPG